MADELETLPAEGEEGYQKPDPKANPRNIALAEIAKTAAVKHAEEAKETAPVIDDDHNPVAAPDAAVAEPETPAEGDDAPVEETPAQEEAPAAEPAPAPAAADPSKEAIDPSKEYEVTIDGQKMKVAGQKIIDAGFRTFQKETAADYRLKVATDLLRKAEEQARTATPQGAVTPAPQETKAEPSDTELAQMLQYGTPEQAAAAMATMRQRTEIAAQLASQRAVATVTNQVAFQEGFKYLETEHKDLIDNPDARQLLINEEKRRRAPKEIGGEGDIRHPKVLFQEIAEYARKSLGIAKPAASQSGSPATVASTAQSRQARKAAAPSVPRTAAGRLAAGAETQKAKTTSEIIAGMAASRGKDRLTPQLRKG